MGLEKEPQANKESTQNLVKSLLLDLNQVWPAVIDGMEPGLPSIVLTTFPEMNLLP